jgi:hypothetical protein
MRQLTSAELIWLWERGHEMPHVQRAVALAEAASAGETGPPAVDLPLGARDHRLMLLRCQLFGTQVSGMDSCGRCGEVLEVTFDLGELAAGHIATTTPVTVVWEGAVLHCRTPTTADVIAAAEAGNPDFSGALLTRCVTTADGRQQQAADLPVPAIAEVMTALAAADPLADTRLAVTCGECGHQWDLTFDIASFLWTEICVAVERILADVHVLASAYGWSEAEVLAVGPRRRQYYLEAVGG